MKSPPLGVLDRYLVRELRSPFAITAGLFTFLLLIDRIYHLTELVVTKGVPFYLVIQLLVYMLPSFLAHTLPMALLWAVLMACGRLAGDLEVVALKAAGVSPLRLFRPILATGLAVAVATAALTLLLNPLANREFQRQLFAILKARAVTGLKERVFNTSFGDIVVYVEDISASQVALKGMLVSDERDPKLSRIITAREGRLLTDEENHRVILRLLNGAVNEADVTPAEPPRTTPGEPTTPGGAAGPERYRHTLFSVYDMSLPIDSPLQGASRIEKPEKDLSLVGLGDKIRELRRDPQNRVPFEVEWHKRFALPLAALVFVLIGFPLAVRSHRGGRSIAIVGSLTILVSYYLLMTSLEGVALRRRLSPAIAIWMPNALFAAIGVTLLVVTMREWRWPPMTRFWRVLGGLRGHMLRRRRAEAAHTVVSVRESTHIVDRYVVRQYLAFIGASLAVAAALFIVVDLFQTLDKFLRVKPPLVYIAEHFAYHLPANLYQNMPVVMLVATIFLFLTLGRHHELTALKAAGVSLYRVSAPVLALGAGVVLAAGLFQELLLPTLNERGEEVDRVKIRGQLPRHLQSRARLWLRSADTRFYRVELLSPGTHDLYGVTVLEIDGEFRVTNRLDARRAHFDTDGGWEFADGAFREIDKPGRVLTVPFTRTAIELEEKVEDFTQFQKPRTAMSYRELRDYITRLEAAGFQVKKYLADLYSKLSLPLMNLIMVLVAIPLALQSPRGGRLVGTALAIVIMAAYFVVHYTAMTFANADLLPPLLAAWTANVIFAGIGLSLFVRART